MRCALLAPSLILLLLAGCSDQDLQRIRKVGNKAWGKANGAVQTAEGKVKNGITTSTSAFGQVSVVGGIEARLMTDPAMKGSSIKVSKSGRKVTLSGTVVSFSQQQRATELARSVQGVGEVQNQLKIKKGS